MGNERIEEVTNYSHVGITLNAFDKSGDRTRDMCSKGRNIMYSMTGIGVAHNGINPLVSTYLFNRICTPSMLHGSELWNTLTDTKITQLERTQCSVLKRIQGFSIRTRSNVVRGMVNQPTVEVLVDRRKLSLLHRLMTLDGGVLKRAFQYTIGIPLIGIHTRCVDRIPQIEPPWVCQHVLIWWSSS